MAKSTEVSKKTLIARAYLLSFPQMMVWAIVFAGIGGLTVWRSMAAQAPPASLLVTPNPAAANSSETFTGCGYIPNQGTTIVSTGPAATAFFGGPADARGCINITNNLGGSPGTYYIKALQDSGPNHKKSKVMGETTLVIN